MLAVGFELIDNTLDGARSLELALIENVAQEDLTPIQGVVAGEPQRSADRDRRAQVGESPAKPNRDANPRPWGGSITSKGRRVRAGRGCSCPDGINRERRDPSMTSASKNRSPAAIRPAHADEPSVLSHSGSRAGGHLHLCRARASIKHIGPLDDQVVLVTGGTGSLGQTVVRRLLSGDLGHPRTVVVFSRCEAKQYAMKTRWKHARDATDDIFYANFEELIQFRIGDVRHYDSVADAVRTADVVLNAAAMKQVPTCEYFPSEAVATNVSGAANVVRAARQSERTHTVIGVSTDKACKPINVMGMTKAIQERILVEGNLHQDHCRMIAVRYGNVLASRGSVLPLFQHQIAQGGPVTLTVPEMTRFLLSLRSAVDTVFAAFEHAEPGEVFVPHVRSARIIDVAKMMIGEAPIELIVTGLRPGEKIHEVLVSEEEAFRTTERAGHYVIQPQLPEFHPADAGRPLAREYSSAEAVVTGQELADLLREADFTDAAMGAAT